MGSGTVEEVVIEQGEKITNGGFDTTSGWATPTGWNISAGTANYDYSTTSYVGRPVSFKAKRYAISFDISNASSGANVNFTNTGSSISGGYVVYQNGHHKIEVSISTAFTDFRIYSTNSGAGAFSLDNISVTEIPSLPERETGTKYWKQGVAGIRATPSKQAHGEWEFDVKKGGTGNTHTVSFISENSNGTNTYVSSVDTSERLGLGKLISGFPTWLWYTAASYIDNNTDYRIKVARLASEGVFKDIPTLQTSDMINQSYTTFTTNGRYGFSATSDGSATNRAGTEDELPIVNAGKYLIEFDLKLNSGTAPTIALRTEHLGTVVSDIILTRNGRNSIILTSTTTSTGVLAFISTSTATDYEVSGLTIRRIYDADTFAVFIKGGDFGNTYNLVSTTGGSGSNPVFSDTYQTSEYFCTDLDENDEFGSLLLTNQNLV